MFSAEVLKHLTRDYTTVRVFDVCLEALVAAERGVRGQLPREEVETLLHVVEQQSLDTDVHLCISQSVQERSRTTPNDPFLVAAVGSILQYDPWLIVFHQIRVRGGRHRSEASSTQNLGYTRHPVCEADNPTSRV